MTTIVCTLEWMAADQRMTDAGPLAHVRKIRRSDDGGSLYGICGAISPGLVFLETYLLASKRDRYRLYRLIPEDSRYEFTVIELSKDGLALWDGWGARIPLLDHVFAVGSGAAHALTAVEKYKAGPDEAIKAAIERDECSGLYREPQVEYLLPPELRRKRRG